MGWRGGFILFTPLWCIVYEYRYVTYPLPIDTSSLKISFINKHVEIFWFVYAILYIKLHNISFSFLTATILFILFWPKAYLALICFVFSLTFATFVQLKIVEVMRENVENGILWYKTHFVLNYHLNTTTTGRLL